MKEVKKGALYGTRRVLVYGVVGILAATVLSSSMLMLPNLFAKTGTLVVKVTDDPVPMLEHLNLTISGVEVLNSTSGWTSIPISGGKCYFDLLELQGVTMDLASVSIPIGDYLKIRLEIEAANATRSDGSSFDLNVPPGHIDLQAKFEIMGGKTTTLIVDITVDSEQIAENGGEGKQANLNPQFKLVVIPPVT